MWRSSCRDTVAQWWGRKRKSITREPKLAAVTADVSAELHVTLAAVLIACCDCLCCCLILGASNGVFLRNVEKVEDERGNKKSDFHYGTVR